MGQDLSAQGTPVLVSACLLGLATRYDGKAKRSEAVLAYIRSHNLIAVPVCPEQLAGMTTPRARTYFSSGDGDKVLRGEGQVVSEKGQEMNEVFCRGAELTLQIARLSNCQLAILKERSPSCGVHQIYLHQTLEEGSGVATARLKEAGIKVVSEEDLGEI